MFRHEIQVPAGFEVVINGQVVSDRRRVLAGRYDRVYFILLAPHFLEIGCEAACREGLSHKLSVMVKVEIDRKEIGNILRDAGHSTFRKVLHVTAEGVAQRQNLARSIQASIQTFAHDTGFFALADLESVKHALHERIVKECLRSRLLGEVVSCDVVRCVPDPILVAQLAASAGIKETSQKEGAARTYEDENLGRIVEYFLETVRQQELIQAETDKAKAMAELSRVDAQSQMAKARADMKMREIEEQDRINERQSEVADKEVVRQEAAQERNARIKEKAAQYEHAHRTRRLDEDALIVAKETQIAQAKDAEQVMLREQKRLDMELELQRRREMAKIRAQESAEPLAHVAAIVGALSNLPVPDLGNIRTVVGGIPETSGQQAIALLLGLVVKAIERLSLGSTPATDAHDAGTRGKE